MVGISTGQCDAQYSVCVRTAATWIRTLAQKHKPPLRVRSYIQCIVWLFDINWYWLKFNLTNYTALRSYQQLQKYLNRRFVTRVTQASVLRKTSYKCKYKISLNQTAGLSCLRTDNISQLASQRIIWGFSRSAMWRCEASPTDSVSSLWPESLEAPLWKPKYHKLVP